MCAYVRAYAPKPLLACEGKEKELSEGLEFKEGWFGPICDTEQIYKNKSISKYTRKRNKREELQKERNEREREGIDQCEGGGELRGLETQRKLKRTRETMVFPLKCRKILKKETMCGMKHK